MTTLRLIILFLLIGLSGIDSEARHLRSEQAFAAAWCQQNNGTLPVKALRAAQPFCETASHRVAVAYAENWAAAIGRALYATTEGEKKPGVALIIEQPADQEHWKALNRSLLHHQLPFRTWIIQP